MPSVYLLTLQHLHVTYQRDTSVTIAKVLTRAKCIARVKSSQGCYSYAKPGSNWKKLSSYNGPLVINVRSSELCYTTHLVRPVWNKNQSHHKLREHVTSNHALVLEMTPSRLVKVYFIV